MAGAGDSAGALASGATLPAAKPTTDAAESAPLALVANPGGMAAVAAADAGELGVNIAGSCDSVSAAAAPYLW